MLMNGKGERLFRILGLVDEDLIEAAAPTRPSAVRQLRRPGRWRRPLAAAACAAVLCAAALGYLAAGGLPGLGSSGPEAGGAPADGSAQGAPAAFSSYAGPVFPLSTVETDVSLTAERTVSWDFSPGTYGDGSPRQWGAAVTDRYVLANASAEDVTVTALYPFAASLADLGALSPTVTVGGEEVEAALSAGAYAGGFRDAGEGDGSTWDLAPPAQWTDHAALLEDGSYLAQALGDAPALDVPVTVYRFSDFAAPHERYRAATQAVAFPVDPAETTVLSYGFNGLSWDTETLWRQYDYFVPDGVRGESELKLLLVLGEDIGDYRLQGYADGSCEEAIDGVSCTVSREETTLDAVLWELCRWELAQADSAAWPGLETLDPALYHRAAAQALLSAGLLADAPADRYADGRLDDFLWDVLAQERVMYLSFPVTVPAGGSATVAAAYWKAPSYDFPGEGDGDLQGYDLVTALGSTLDFTALRVALADAGGVELVWQDWGLQLSGGTAEAALDPSAPHYSLVVRPLSP